MSIYRNILIILLVISSMAGCIFDSDSDKKDRGEMDAGTYTLLPDTGWVETYLNGGALIGITFEPGEIFSGDVDIVFAGPSYIQGSFFDDSLTAQDDYTDLLLKVDRNAPLGTNDCEVISFFAGHADTIRITMDILDGYFLKDRTYLPNSTVLEWFAEQNQDFDTLISDTWFGYSFYPEMMVGGGGSMYVSDHWILRTESSPVPPAIWYCLRKRGECEQLLYALAAKGTIMKVDLLSFPPNRQEREKYLSIFYTL